MAQVGGREQPLVHRGAIAEQLLKRLDLGETWLNDMNNLDNRMILNHYSNWILKKNLVEMTPL